MELDVLIPAYNESEKIVETVKALKSLPEIREIIVVDDGSVDGTAGKAEQAGARVIRMERNMGKGKAVVQGASYLKSPYLALIDADLGETAGELSHLLTPIKEGKAEMTVAVFPPQKKKGGMSVVKKMAGWFIRRSFGRVFREPLSGQRVFRRELLKFLTCPPRGFGLEIALTLDLLKIGCTILEVETAMRHRERGRDASSWVHRGRQFGAVLRELWLRRGLIMKGVP